MARLSEVQTRALGDWWLLAQDFANSGLTATELIEQAAPLAVERGRSLTFDESTAIAVLYGYGRRMYWAAQEVQRALDSDGIEAKHLGVPPWARDEQVMNAAPIWHVTYKFMFTDQQGVLHEEWRTSVFEMTFPATIGELKDAIGEDAAALAEKYRVNLVGTVLERILSV